MIIILSREEILRSWKLSGMDRTRFLQVGEFLQARARASHVFPLTGRIRTADLNLSMNRHQELSYRWSHGKWTWLRPSCALLPPPLLGHPFRPDFPKHWSMIQCKAVWSYFNFFILQVPSPICRFSSIDINSAPIILSLMIHSKSNTASPSLSLTSLPFFISSSPP